MNSSNCPEDGTTGGVILLNIGKFGYRWCSAQLQSRHIAINGQQVAKGLMEELSLQDTTNIREIGSKCFASDSGIVMHVHWRAQEVIELEDINEGSTIAL